MKQPEPGDLYYYYDTPWIHRDGKFYPFLVIAAQPKYLSSLNDWPVEGQMWHVDLTILTQWGVIETTFNESELTFLTGDSADVLKLMFV